MLKALYDYGIRNNLSVPPGFIKKPIRAYICLTQTGEFLGIEQCGKEEIQTCPDIGSMANSPDKCNPLAEKAEIILGYSEKKSEYFRKLLKEGGQSADCLNVCLYALGSGTTLTDIRQEAELRKVKNSDRISFRVDGTPVVADQKILQWWMEYRKTLTEERNVPLTRCLITGELTAPLATLPVVSGLQVVGGHSRGEALFCFDKSAFQSYGLKQSANAPVSEEAFAVVKEAVNDLLAGAPAMYNREKNRDFNPTAPIYAGMKFLHWYDFSLNPEDDLIYNSFQADDEEESEESEELHRQAELEKRDKADAVINAVLSGGTPKRLQGNYHILLISGNNGRAVIRRYEHGSYQNLRENLKKWTDDLALQDNYGTGLLRPKKLYARLIRLVKNQNNTGQKLSEQIKKELAGITPAIIMAIINGTPLPDTVAVRALSYIRSKLLSAGDSDKKTILPDGIACQWLKVWLVRKRKMRNEEENLMECYDPNFNNAAYHCGAWLAVYANLQRAAMEDINATLVQRFYASASRTPALVFGTLERMGTVYLDKLHKEKRGIDRIYEEKLNEVCAFFGSAPDHQLPATLNLEGQSYFALGYRQMCTQIIADIKDRQEKNQEGK